MHFINPEPRFYCFMYLYISLASFIELKSCKCAFGKKQDWELMWIRLREWKPPTFIPELNFRCHDLCIYFLPTFHWFVCVFLRLQGSTESCNTTEEEDMKGRRGTQTFSLFCMLAALWHSNSHICGPSPRFCHFSNIKLSKCNRKLLINQ